MAGIQRSLFETNDNMERLDPREYLRRRMAVKGITPTQLAEEIDVSVQTIYYTIRKKRPISDKLAVKLAKFFEESVDVWLGEGVTVDPDGASLAPLRKPIARNTQRDAGPADLPLLRDISESPSGILVDREINALLRSDDPGIRITPYSLNQIEAASYDLTVGLIIYKNFKALPPEDWGVLARHLYNDPLGEQEKKKLPRILSKVSSTDYTLGKVHLQKLDSVTIVAREYIQFSNLLVADVGSVSQHARNGLLVNHGFQIDPGYAGSIIVTAMQINDEAFTIEPGQKLVSLAIRRLPRAPDKSYSEDVDRKLRLIGREVEEALKDLFIVEELRAGIFRAHSGSFDGTFTSEQDADDALMRAVAWILETIERKGAGVIDAELRNALETSVLKCVLVELEHVDTLVKLFGVTARERIEKGKEFFDRHNKQDRQTLWDVLDHLGVNPIASLEKMVRN